MVERITLRTLHDLTKVNRKTTIIKKSITITDDLVVGQVIDERGRVDPKKCTVSSEKLGEYICDTPFDEMVKIIEGSKPKSIGLAR